MSSKTDDIRKAAIRIAQERAEDLEREREIFEERIREAIGEKSINLI